MAQTRELMDRISDLIMDNDQETLRDVYAADVVVTTPDAGSLHGIDEFLGYLQGLAAAFSDMRYEATGKYETDEAAIDQGELIAVHSGPMALPDGRTVEPTGKEIRLRSIDVIKVRDGKVVAHDFYFDQMEMATQLGLLEQPAEATP